MIDLTMANQKQQTPPRMICSVRLSLSFVAFFVYAISYLQRINMGIAILCMVNNTALDLENLAAVPVPLNNENADRSIDHRQSTDADDELLLNQINLQPRCLFNQTISKRVNGSKNSYASSSRFDKYVNFN